MLVNNNLLWSRIAYLNGEIRDKPLLPWLSSAPQLEVILRVVIIFVFTFMHVKECSDAMSGPVPVVKAHRPERTSCQDVNITSVRPRWPDCCREVNNSHQDACIGFLEKWLIFSTPRIYERKQSSPILFISMEESGKILMIAILMIF